MFYLATPPGLLGPIRARLGQHGLAGGETPRVVVEKPLGKDLSSAMALNAGHSPRLSIRRPRQHGRLSFP
ncbi:hypothetical protein [Xanthobacter versatilis]|uniref:hypothetical protein n=1 Tax=Xanthobacter autotrophicus (strain ATCC BAA-1158 / Py2) TaxID=78245 RepID=UPI00372D2FE8